MAAATARPLTKGSGGGASRAAWWAIARFGLSVLLISLALSLLVVPWLDLPWLKIVRRCVSIAAAISLWLCIKKFEGRSFRSYGLGGTGPASSQSRGGTGKRQFLFGLGVGIATLGLMLVIGLVTGVYEIAVTPDRAKLWRTVLSFIPAAFLVSILEELVFRGFLLQQLMRACATPLAVAISGALYALVHLRDSSWTAATYRELFGLFLLGGVLALSYLRTRQLYFAIGLHAALAYGARVNKLVIQIPDASLSWLTGTSRLINGVVSWIVLLCLGGLLVWWTRAPRAGKGNREGMGS